MVTAKEPMQCAASGKCFDQGENILEGLKLIATSQPCNFSIVGAKILFSASSVQSPPLQYGKTIENSKISSIEIEPRDLHSLRIEFLS